MRLAIAELKQETNGFVPFTTTLKTFEDQYFYRGEEMLTRYGDGRLPACHDPTFSRAFHNIPHTTAQSAGQV